MFYDIYSKLCDSRGISKGKAAEEIGISGATVTKWKQTGRTPSGATLARIAKYFDVSVSELLEQGEKEPGSIFTAEQSEALSLLGKLPPERQEEAIRYLRYLVSTQDK